jgi:vacuolar-type H+-ATPase subunit E/Vma4
MSLESIVEQILNEANSEREKIIQQAQIEAQGLIQEAKIEADRIYQDLLAKERQKQENQKQKQIVSSRLTQRKKLLETKQGIINSVFEKIKALLKPDKLKKQIVLANKVQESPLDTNVYLGKLRRDYETEIAKILFDEI